MIVSLAAFVFPSRRPDLYQASPANVKFAGIPVLKIVAPLVDPGDGLPRLRVLAYPPLALGNPDNTWWVPAFMG